MENKWLSIEDKKELYTKEQKLKRIKYILDKNFEDLSWDMIREYIIYENDNTCAKCKLNKWQEYEIPLEINHIDGNNSNHVKYNLECLCPNCHALTGNWRGRNKTKADKVTNEKLLEFLLINDWNMRKSLIDAGLTAKGGNYKRCHKIKREYEELGEVITEINILPKIEKEEFERLFCKFDSHFEFANFIGVSINTIKRWSKDYGLKREPKGANISKEMLINDFSNLKTFTAVGRKYRVSDNSVRKWCRKYDILELCKNMKNI